MPLQTPPQGYISLSTGATTGFLYNVDQKKSFSCHAVITNQSGLTPPTFNAATGVDTSTEVITTATDHGLAFGTKIQLTISGGGALPTGLALATDYFVILLSSNTLKLASSLANALAGTPVNITAAGTGTATITPVALAGGNFKLQGSNVDSDIASKGNLAGLDAAAGNWIDLPSQGGNVTTDTNVHYEATVVTQNFKYIRALMTLTAGQVLVSLYSYAQD